MIREEYLKRVDELLKHEHQYYVLEEPLISDKEYDLLYKELEEIEDQHPEWKVNYSPTTRVGGGVVDSFLKVEHSVPLLSLDNSYNEEDLLRFQSQVEKEGQVTYVCEWKIDGLSVALEYREGLFFRASTRGDGFVGEDITQNMRTISALPMKLKDPVSMIVRAEVYMPKKSFQALNDEHEKTGGKIFANARNAASGSLRQQDSSITRKRNLSFFVFEVLESERPFTTHEEKLTFLREQGFLVAPFKVYKDLRDALKNIEEMNRERVELPFDVDGLVFKVNETALREKLGYRTKSPKYAIAYKFEAERVETLLEGVRWTVGRTGVVTPTALLEPVWISGSKVSKASLHNVDYIKEKDLRLEDTVLVEKAGEIIPQIVGVDLEKRKTDIEIEIPKTCPSCHEELVHLEGEAFIKCVNLSCQARLLRSLSHYVSRQAMDMDGLGEKNLQRFIVEGFIKALPDIYRLKDHREALVNLEGFGERSIDQLLEEIEKSKDRPLSRFLFGLGIDLIGIVAARDLASKFLSLEALMKASEEDILSLKGFGKEMTHSLLDFFSIEANKELLEELKELKVFKEEEQREVKNLNLTFVVTGSFEGYSRDDLHGMIREHGGTATGSVTKKTDYVVVGEKAGSKEEKAKSLGIKTIGLEELFELLGVEK